MNEDVDDEAEKKDEETKEARIAIRALKSLRDSQGWQYIMRILDARIKERTDYVMLTPRKEMNDHEIEFQRGEAAMARYLKTLVETEIETLTAVKEATQ